MLIKGKIRWIGFQYHWGQRISSTISLRSKN